MKQSRVNLQMFLSYMLILLIPIAVSAGIYGYSRKIVRTQAEQLNNSMLEMVRRDMDQRNSEMQKIAARLAMDTRVQQSSMVRGNFDADDRMNLYYLFKDLQILAGSEDLIDDVFVYFYHTGTISSINGNMSAELYYNLYYRDAEYSFEEFRQYMEKFHYNDLITLRGTDGRERLILTMMSLNPSLGEAAATIGIAVDFTELRKLLQMTKWADGMEVTMIGPDGIRISTESDSSLRYDLEYGQLKEGTYVRENAFSGGSMISVLDSQVSSWKYVTVTPLTVVEKQARQIQLIAVIGLFGCVVLGLVISYYLTRKNYNPIRGLVEVFQKHGSKEIGKNDNEYQWLHIQADDFFRRQGDAEQMIRDNRKNIRKYLLLQLLLNDSGVSRREMEEYGIRLDQNYNVVVLFKLVKQEQEKDAMLLRFIIMNVFQEMCLNYFNTELTEMGENVAAIVNLPANTAENLDILKEQIENLQVLCRERFQFGCAALAGSVCEGLDGIHISWQRAEELAPYTELLDSDLIFYDDVKNSRVQYEYTMEQELQILNAMEIGDGRRAVELMEQVFDRNMEGQVSADSCRYLICDMTGTLLRGSSLGGCPAEQLDFPDIRNIQQFSPAEIRKRFRKLMEEICGRIQEKKQKNDQDNTLSRRIEEFIRENYRDPDLNISITSQHFDITPAYMSSIYKKQTGGSILDYINTLRISRAQELLENGCSVVEAASQTGFRDSGSLIRAFKKKTGVTPGQFKKKF